MMNDADELIKLERALLDDTVRRNAVRLDELLDDAFVEFGASGRAFDKGNVISRLPLEHHETYRTQNMKVMALATGVALVTYESVRVSGRNENHHFSRRSSIWKKTSGNWKMVFHQGTPSTDFEEIK